MAQVEVDNKFVMDTTHHIKEVSAPIDSLDGTTENSIKNNLFNGGNASLNSNNIVLSLSAAINSYETGLMVVFIPDQGNTGPVTIDIGNLGSQNIFKYGNIPLEEGDITAGVPYQIFYDGVQFQIINVGDKSCPQNTVEVNENLCTEINSRNGELFFDAIVSCRDDGGRLCSWSEWISACDANIAVLGDYGDQWEWVNSNSDHNMGSKIVGLNSCKNNWHMNSNDNNNNLINYRCCYDK